MKRNRFGALLGLCACIGLATALCCAPMPAVAADTQGYGMQPYTLCSAFPLTNGSTTTLNLSTNLPTWAGWKGDVQLMAIIGPNAANAPTNGNFCTNLVLKFDYLVGTNATTDTPFTWTIATDQFVAMTTTPHTNPVCVWTNLSAKGGLSGLRLTSALPSSTNAVGPNLTLLLQVQRN